MIFQFNTSRQLNLSNPTKHKTRTNLNLIFSPQCSLYCKNIKFSVFTVQCTKVGENYNSKRMHGVMKAKGINVGEIKIGTTLGEIHQKFVKNLSAAC